MYGRQLREAEDFEALRATISIVFVNDVLFPEVADYHLDFQLRSARHPALIFCDHQAIHLLELPKFHRPAEDLPGPLDVWCYFLVHGAELDRDKLPAALCVPPLQKAMEVLEMLTKNDVEWLEYQARRIAEMDQISRLKSARLVGHQEGRQEGRQEGLQEGVEKGELIGRIHVCQRMLRTLVTPNIELTALAVPELRAMAEGLEKQAGVAEN
jgi:predicted transposase/invertase (TIGR01784 family)